MKYAAIIATLLLAIASSANAAEDEVECRVVANVPAPSRSEVPTDSVVISSWTGPTPKMMVEHTLHAEFMSVTS